MRGAAAAAPFLLQRRGYRVFRVHNAEVYENIDRVLEALHAFIEEKGA